MQTLLITGGSGYLGRQLAAQASAAGYQVAATWHTHSPTLAGVAWHQIDLRDAAATMSLIDALQPDAIIHTAYVQSGPDLVPVTATAAGSVARAARRNSARLIHMSSDAIFDGEQEAAYTETDPPSPVHPYGVAKAAAEQLVAEAHPMASIVRTSLIYGGPTPGPHERIVFDALSGRADIVFFTDERRCPIAVADLAAALLELVPLDHAGPLHIAGAETISRYAFACAVAGAAGYRTDGLRSGLSTASGMRRPRNCALRIDRARALLTTPLRGVSDVLGNTVG